MTYTALVKAFSKIEDLPIPVDAVLKWIQDHTDHKDLRLHPVSRQSKAFRGAFRRLGIPTGKPYSGDYDLICQVLYGQDLPEDWKRMVIVKEALHVFDPAGHHVNTADAVRKLIQQVITPELKQAPFAPAVDDFLGPYRAMAVLLPRAARRKLRRAYEAGTRTSSEIASYARLPDYYVEIWLDIGEEAEHELAGF
jgi:hypothetical protein